MIKPEAANVAPRNQSINMANVLEAQQQNNLTNKLQHVRESSAMKSGYYPQPVTFGKKAPPKEDKNAKLPLEMVLLKNKMIN